MARLYRRVTLIEQDGTRTKLFSKKVTRKKKRVSKGLRPVERAQKRWLDASNVFTSELLRRHRRSRLKKKNRWLTDAPINFLKAQRKGLDRL
jgi:hypothetical protein